MIAELGRFLIALALALSAAQMLFAWAGARDPGGAFARAGARAAHAALAALVVAFALLTVLFLQSDFSVAYVAANSHVDKPLFYMITGVWGGHEGSMLLWCLLLTAVGAGLAKFGPRGDPALRVRAVSVQGALQLMFLAFLALASNPFDRLDPAALEGSGLNPILQDPALAIHPPMLFLGYVGLSGVYSLAMAGLIEGRKGQPLGAAMRPWALGAWTALTAGIALGSWWAYYELGWGGWWFWDPVENASFMPWLMATALIHSAIASDRMGAFPGWTTLLALLAFTLSALGAFLVRSGVLTSVHAFALDPERGLWLLAILIVIAGAGLALFALRAHRLGAGQGFSPTSREAFIGANNLLLAAAAGVVFTGTLYPLFVDALGGRPVSVGAPYFDATATPILAFALVLMPFAPFMAWAKGGLRKAATPLRAAGLILPAAIAGLTALALGAPPLAALGAAIGAWAVAGAGLDIARWSGAVGLGPKLALAGRAMAHAGVGFIALGAASDASWPYERMAILAPGESMTAHGRVLTMQRIMRADGPNYMSDLAEIAVTRDGRAQGVLRPERRYYPAADQTTREVAIRTGLAGDLYVALGEPRQRDDGAFAFEVRAAFNPLIWMLGFGAALVTLGGLAALSARGVERRRPG
ncbi:MAG: heme lyase CcmF/NrfE family subunit [Maricaulaceae bacterium]|nr:heme lyase CcmF/NrfE family subunit [Maricaulaceae bacterium]